MAAYYNEIDPYAAQWLRNLIAAGHIAPGEVDERSVVDVRGDDLRGYTQCHFFAGIGIWSHALRLAGWADDRPVWTGSCPCQPYSVIGEGGSFADERDLWPDWFRVICEAQCQQRAIPLFGEQVASDDGLTWLDAVFADLEATGYTVGAVDTCAAGFGAPTIGQRFYFMGAPRVPGLEGHAGHGDDWSQPGQHPASAAGHAAEAGLVNGWWADAEWVACADGKRRCTRPGAFPVVDGAASRVGRLRAYGNAICAPQAAEFIRACMSV